MKITGKTLRIAAGIALIIFSLVLSDFKQDVVGYERAAARMVSYIQKTHLANYEGRCMMVISLENEKLRTLFFARNNVVIRLQDPSTDIKYTADIRELRECAN